MTNPSLPKNPSLEIRINSLADAKAVVFNLQKINQTVESLSLDSIEFVIASEVRTEVAGIIYGAFRGKTYTHYVFPRNGNALFSLPHFQDKKEPIVVVSKAPKVEQTMVGARRRPGRPPKAKVVPAEHEPQSHLQ